jgi:hypothetical protein
MLPVIATPIWIQKKGFLVAGKGCTSRRNDDGKTGKKACKPRNAVGKMTFSGKTLRSSM